MTDTLNVAHAFDCATRERQSCEPIPACTCDYAEAQGLAAEIKFLRIESNAWLKAADRLGDELTAVRLDANAWMETANQIGSEYETLRRLAGDACDQFYNTPASLKAMVALAAHLKEKPC